mgnify:CR=1 FL=1
MIPIILSILDLITASTLIINFPKAITIILIAYLFSKSIYFINSTASKLDLIAAALLL